MNERAIFTTTTHLCAQTSVLEDLVDEEPRQHVARNEEDLAKYHVDVDVGGQQPGQERSVAVGGPVVRGSSLPKWRHDNQRLYSIALSACNELDLNPDCSI